jgi:hypothetical protein
MNADVGLLSAFIRARPRPVPPTVNSIDHAIFLYTRRWQGWALRAALLFLCQAEGQRENVVLVRLPGFIRHPDDTGVLC